MNILLSTYDNDPWHIQVQCSETEAPRALSALRQTAPGQYIDATLRLSPAGGTGSVFIVLTPSPGLSIADFVSRFLLALSVVEK